VLQLAMLRWGSTAFDLDLGANSLLVSPLSLANKGPYPLHLP